MTDYTRLRRDLRLAAYQKAHFNLRDTYPHLFRRIREDEVSARPDTSYASAYMRSLGTLRRRYPGVFRRFYEEELDKRGITL